MVNVRVLFDPLIHGTSVIHAQHTYCLIRIRIGDVAWIVEDKRCAAATVTDAPATCLVCALGDP